MSEKIIYEEYSQRTKNGIYTIIFFTVLILIWMAYTTYRSLVIHEPFLGEYFVQVAVLFALYYQGLGQYRYILTETKLVIYEKNIFGTKKLEIPYNRIDGVSEFYREFFGRLKYRYKYRKAATADKRPLWQLVYSIVPESPNKKVKYVRVLLKANDEFFETLDRFIPKKVYISMDEVAFNAVLREEAHKLGYEYDDYLVIFEKERMAEADGEKGSEDDESK